MKVNHTVLLTSNHTMEHMYICHRIVQDHIKKVNLLLTLNHPDEFIGKRSRPRGTTVALVTFSRSWLKAPSVCGKQGISPTALQLSYPRLQPETNQTQYQRKNRSTHINQSELTKAEHGLNTSVCMSVMVTPAYAFAANKPCDHYSLGLGHTWAHLPQIRWQFGATFSVLTWINLNLHLHFICVEFKHNFVDWVLHWHITTKKLLFLISEPRFLHSDCLLSIG